MYKDSDAYASWLILEAANQGRPTEFIAQQVASMIESGSMERHEIHEFWGDVIRATGELLATPLDIWGWLLPGGADPSLPPLEHPAETHMNEVAKMFKEEASWGDIYEFVRATEYGRDLQPQPHIDDGPPVERVVLMGRMAEGNRWLVMHMETGEFGWWSGTVYNNLSNPAADQLAAPDVIEVEEMDLNWFDGDSIASAAKAETHITRARA